MSYSTVCFVSLFFLLIWLDLLFGTWGRPRRLKFSYKQEAGWGNGGSVKGRPHKALLSYSYPFSLLLLSPEREHMRNKKENKVLDRQVNSKLHRGTQSWKGHFQIRYLLFLIDLFLLFIDYREFISRIGVIFLLNTFLTAEKLLSLLPQRGSLLIY